MIVDALVLAAGIGSMGYLTVTAGRVISFMFFVKGGEGTEACVDNPSKWILTDETLTSQNPGTTCPVSIDNNNSKKLFHTVQISTEIDKFPFIPMSKRFRLFSSTSLLGDLYTDTKVLYDNTFVANSSHNGPNFVDDKMGDVLCVKPLVTSFKPYDAKSLLEGLNIKDKIHGSTMAYPDSDGRDLVITNPCRSIKLVEKNIFDGSRVTIIGRIDPNRAVVPDDKKGQNQDLAITSFDTISSKQVASHSSSTPLSLMKFGTKDPMKLLYIGNRALVLNAARKNLWKIRYGRIGTAVACLTTFVLWNPDNDCYC